MVTEKAMELGQAIVESAEFKEYEEAKKNFEQNEEAVALLDEYTRKEERMRQLVSSGSFDSEEMKTLSAEIELLRQAAVAHPLIIELNLAQAAFSGVMAMVNNIITAYINPEAATATGGCSGDCASCAGCR